MAPTLTRPSPSDSSVASAPSRAPAPARRPFRDNTKLILLGILLLIGLLVGLLALANRSSTLSPDVLTELVLYALSITNLTMLAVLVFVLARNIVKLIVERRRALPFARFRAKLVALLLGMTVVPAVLVLLVGSELIRNSVDRWFNAPMDDVLSSANRIAGDYYQEHQRLVSAEARRVAQALAGIDLADRPLASAGWRPPVGGQHRIQLIEIFSVTAAPGARVTLVDTSAGTDMPRADFSTSAIRLAMRAARTGIEAHSVDSVENGAELIRAAVPIRALPNGPVRGVAMTSEYLTGQFAGRARRIANAYERYQQLRVLKRPLAGVYLAFFLMLTLLILVGASWMGLYLAKRITMPIQRLAEAAKEIGAGRLDHRVEAQSNDELGALTHAFNRMASELAVSRRRLEREGLELERKHHEVESRRRYVETVLDRVATGVVSIDAAGGIRTWNSAASRLLGIDARVAGLPAAAVFGTPELKPLGAVLDAAREPVTPRPHEVVIAHQAREVHLTVMVTPLRRDEGEADGVVMVFDDVSPLIRAQKVAAWREVARRLAHEIKNPLTPIRLCAERMQRHFSGAPEATRALVDECAATIVGEVESLKGLVDEFAQFARMPAPRAVATDLHQLLDETVVLYRGLFSDVEIRVRYAAALPKVSVDPEQIRRVIVNLIDNAIEAMARSGVIEVETVHDPSNRLVRIAIADDGPGLPSADKEKLFLPYYSTKQRGSGLGLAIVRRIVAEHGGTVEALDNLPRGTRFCVELPV